MGERGQHSGDPQWFQFHHPPGSVSMRSAVLVENLRRQVHLRGQEFAALNAEVASLKAQVMELQRSLHHANQHIATLQKDNEDYNELVQVLQA